MARIVKRTHTEPYKLVAGGEEKYLCRCGLSKNQPFCDGSHKGTGLTPVGFKPQKSGEHWLCGCKSTGTKPFCDGTHNRV